MEQSTHEQRGPGAASVPAPRVIAEIEAAFDAGSLGRVADLIEHDFLASWAYLPPSRFVEILAVLLRSSDMTNPLVRTIGAMLFAEEIGEPFSPPFAQTRDTAARYGLPAKQLAMIGRMFGLRLRGRPVESAAISDELARLVAPAPILDPHRGWALFIAVQHGVTAMLAGEFSKALAHFTDARLQSPHPSLGFLVRGACAKSAMIEAIFGDEQKAALLLEEVELTPRTQSWAEASVDAVRTITTASLSRVEPDEAVRMLDTVRLSALGEMWPFYIVTVLRRSIQYGDLAECRRRLSAFERLSLPHVTGQGFTGSVFPLANALLAIASGDVGTAREHLEAADPRSPDSTTALALLELSAQRPREALRATARLHDRVAGLRLLETLRYAVNAGAHLALGDLTACDAVVRMALDRPGGIRPQEVALFPPDVRARAERRFSAWPREAARPTIGLQPFSTRLLPFTRREIEIIRSLGQGLSREEIAREHFVTINTVKSHLRMIYRKLGVSSRSAALLEAERRGLLH